MLSSALALTGKEPKVYDKHRLMPLWSELRHLLNELGLERSDANANAVHQFIRQLDDADPGSMVFRYATTNSGKDHLPDVTYINIRHLREVLNSVFVWLNGTYSWIGEMEQGQPGG